MDTEDPCEPIPVVKYEPVIVSAVPPDKGPSVGLTDAIVGAMNSKASTNRLSRKVSGLLMYKLALPTNTEAGIPGMLG